MNKELQEKYRHLQNIIREMQSVVVAYSGGVDSTFLAFVCHTVLKDNSIAVTSISETYPQKEYQETISLARQFGLNHRIIQTSELSSENFVSNTVNRCYYCKQELFKKLREIADKENIPNVLDGTTLSDAEDFRPGQKAAKELNILSPLAKVELTKKEVRELSKSLKIPTWDKPSYACLASRFPYGEKITINKLQRVEKAEDLLHRLGFRTCRVRSHQNIARIEVNASELSSIIKVKDEIITKLHNLNYDYITLDLEGYRSGSMNKNITTLSRNNKLSHPTSRKKDINTNTGDINFPDNNLDTKYYLCPHCQNQKLKETVTEKNKYHQCNQCGGVWFEINELEKAVENKIEFYLPETIKTSETIEKIKQTKCPSCSTNMSIIKSLEIPDVKISACMICQGRWISGQQIAQFQKRGLLKQVGIFIMRLF
ncbi:MAG: ATP-dependent sacrificial sulfur transferase LarE [Planctomycetota bacterium]